MSYYFFLGDTMLPIPPARVDTKINGKNKTINLINEGEVNLLKTTGLTDISFTFSLPNSVYPFANYDNSLQSGLIDYALNEVSRRFHGLGGNSFLYKPAKHFLDSLKVAKESKNPIRLIITRMGMDYKPLWHTNMLCTIESYTIQENANNQTDLEIPISLKEYRYFGTKNVGISKDENGVERLIIKENRYTPPGNVPAALKITQELSVLEAVKNATHGTANWRDVATASGISNPLEKDLKGKVLTFV